MLEQSDESDSWCAQSVAKNGAISARRLEGQPQQDCNDERLVDIGFRKI